jgi:hypothetical protein
VEVAWGHPKIFVILYVIFFVVWMPRGMLIVAGEVVIVASPFTTKIKKRNKVNKKEIIFFIQSSLKRK